MFHLLRSKSVCLTPSKTPLNRAFVPRSSLLKSSNKSISLKWKHYCDFSKLKIHEDIELKLQQAFKLQSLHVVDTSGRGSFFQVEIVAPEFAGLNTLEKHKLVHNALHDEMPQIHGIQIRARAPEKE